MKLWSKNTHTGQIYPGLRHTIKIFPATLKILLAIVTVATLILACLIYRSHIRIRVLLHMPAFFTVEIIQLTGRPPYKYPTAQSCIATLNAAKSTNSWPSSIGPGMVCRGTRIRREQYRLIVRRAWDSDLEGTVSVDCTKSLGLGFGGNSVG